MASANRLKFILGSENGSGITLTPEESLEILNHVLYEVKDTLNHITPNTLIELIDKEYGSHYDGKLMERLRGVIRFEGITPTTRLLRLDHQDSHGGMLPNAPAHESYDRLWILLTRDGSIAELKLHLRCSVPFDFPKAAADPKDVIVTPVHACVRTIETEELRNWFRQRTHSCNFMIGSLSQATSTYAEEAERRAKFMRSVSSELLAIKRRT